MRAAGRILVVEYGWLCLLLVTITPQFLVLVHRCKEPICDHHTLDSATPRLGLQQFHAEFRRTDVLIISSWSIRSRSPSVALAATLPLSAGDYAFTVRLWFLVPHCLFLSEDGGPQVWCCCCCHISISGSPAVILRCPTFGCLAVNSGSTAHTLPVTSTQSLTHNHAHAEHLASPDLITNSLASQQLSSLSKPSLLSPPTTCRECYSSHGAGILTTTLVCSHRHCSFRSSRRIPLRLVPRVSQRTRKDPDRRPALLGF